MDEGQLLYMAGRLTLGAAAVFFAIILWSKTRDPAWMLAVTGVIAAYAETVYSVLKTFGITAWADPSAGSAPFLPVLLSNLPAVFFLAAFAAAAARKSRRLPRKAGARLKKSRGVPGTPD